MSSTSIASAFYAGLYGEVLARTIDGRAFDYAEEDTPFVVGALAFTGRIEEARAVLADQRRSGDATGIEHLRARVASKFFLGVAYSRAGRHDLAEREFRENLRAAGAHGDPICRFYVAQGLACFRYFRGLMAKATRHVRRSLRHAIEARFQYGRLLASDLRGHTLVQIGQVRAGLVLLERARDLARALDLPGNAGAIDCSIVAYRACFGVVPLARAIEELEALARATAAEDGYSRRAVETDLAKQLALAGRCDEAWERLQALSDARIPDGDGRARVRFLLSCATVAHLRYGVDSARTYVAEARAALGDGYDYALEVDLVCAELAIASPDERPALVAHVEALYARTGISRAAVYATIFGDASHDGGCAPLTQAGSRASPGTPLKAVDSAAAVRVAELEEDPAGARLASVWSAGVASVDKLLRDGYLGLVPLAARIPPEASIIEASPERLVVAERGRVRVLDDVPAGGARLLREIAAGEGKARAWRTKEQLVGTIWGVSRYRPDRHDAIVHTAVSRLRSLLGTAGHWIECHDGAYRLAPQVAFRGPSAAPPAASPEPAHAEPPQAEGDGAGREGALLAHLDRAGACSTAEVAGALKVSEMTAFRTIRSLMDRGLVRRMGKGPSTRYARADSEERRRS